MLSKKIKKEIKDPKDAILNLTEILPVDQASILNLQICPFFILKEGMKDIVKNFPIKFTINKSDPLGPFIESEYNKDGDSFRSPWSNKYFPPKESNKLLPNELRELEQRVNQLIKTYLKIYYSEDAISSAYIMFQDESISNGFLCSVFIKSSVNNSEYLKDESFLESTNIISVKFMKEKSNTPNKERIKVMYKTNTYFLYKIKFKNLDNCEYNGTNNCINSKTTYTNNYFDYEKHLRYIGNSIEENEGNLRLKLEMIGFDKNNYICKEIRMEEGQDGETNTQINNLKKIYTEFEKYASARKMKAELQNERKKI